MQRQGIWAAAVVVLGSLSAGCSREASVEAVKVYRHSEDGSPTTIDPLQSSNVFSNTIVLAAYDTLYRYKYLARPYELVPNLAAAMPEISPDGLTYTIRLKRGVEFIDDPAFAQGAGREVVADDFVYSIKRHFDPDNISAGAWLWDARIEGLEAWIASGAEYEDEISGLRALDSHTVEIRLTRPYPQLPFTLAMGYSAVVPREAVDHYGPELGRRAVGSGPFRLTRLDTTRAVLLRNDDFRREPLDLEAEGYDPATQGELGLERLAGLAPPYVDRLEIDFIDEQAARWASFTSGREIQYTRAPPEQIPTVLASTDPPRLAPEHAERFHMRTEVESGLVFWLFNMADPAVGYNDDPKRDRMNHALRCAIRDAFDWGAQNERFYAGIGVVFPGVIPPVVPEFDPSMDRDSVRTNPDRARRRLAEAGWNEGNLPVLEYASTSSTVYREMYEQFRGNLARIGYPAERIELRTFANFGDFNRAFRNKELMFFGYGWTLDYPDAENTMQLFYGPNGAPGSNAANYRNPEYDALYEQAAVMQPGPARTELFARMNRMLIDDCVGLTSLSRRRVFLWHKSVIGLPDREVLGPFWLRWVDVATDQSPGA